MLVFTNKKDLQNHIKKKLDSNENIGFVPTMGALHVGHISLVNNSLTENKVTVVSIFVNPTQFNNSSDLDNYPRTLEGDLTLLKKASKNIIVFAPSATELYNGEPESKQYNFEGLEHQMEGKYRPGHFDGVGTVLTLLFDAVQPTRAYFGEKDFQQLQVVRKLVDNEQIPVQVVGCKIYREANGLAYSSRNERLTKEQRSEGKLLFDELTKVKSLFGTKSVDELYRMVAQKFEQHTLFTLEYFEIAAIDDLKPIDKIEKNKKYRAFIAVFAGEVRLIDNIALN